MSESIVGTDLYVVIKRTHTYEVAIPMSEIIEQMTDKAEGTEPTRYLITDIIQEALEYAAMANPQNVKGSDDFHGEYVDLRVFHHTALTP